VEPLGGAAGEDAGGEVGVGQVRQQHRGRQLTNTQSMSRDVPTMSR
jgi:hypothetical protein